MPKPLSMVKGTLDYSVFEQLAQEEDEADMQGQVLLVSGRRGWNNVINGVYIKDGELNGAPKFRKGPTSEASCRWLKRNDSAQWMISRHPDGRALGEALTLGGIGVAANGELALAPGPWYVCDENGAWAMDPDVAVAPGECGNCGHVLCSRASPAGSLPSRCSTCRRVAYCNRQCQKRDWPNHRRLCQRPSRVEPNVVAVADGEGATDSIDFPAASAQEHELRRGVAAKGSQLSSRPMEAGTRHTIATPSSSLKLDEVNRCVTHQSSLSRLPGAWEEKDLTWWMRRRLDEIFEGTRGDLSVPCGGPGGSVKAMGVKDVEGSAWMAIKRGTQQAFFDMSFTLVVKATWVADMHCMSTEGSVQVTGFGDEFAREPQASCGMVVSFVDATESPVDDNRECVQKVVPLAQRSQVMQSLGATHWEIARGRGLMYKVHEELRRIAAEFMQQ